MTVYFNEHGEEIKDLKKTIPCFKRQLEDKSEEFYVLYSDGSLYDKFVKPSNIQRTTYYKVNKEIYETYLQYLRTNDYSYYTTAKKEIAVKGYQ